MDQEEQIQEMFRNPTKEDPAMPVGRTERGGKPGKPKKGGKPKGKKKK
jgi:hypothetical protein